MLPLLLASCAVVTDAGGCHPSVCSCQALTAGGSMRNSMRSVRKAANSLDLGMLDTMLLDGSQTALGEAVESVRSLHATCSAGHCGNGTSLLPRRSCRCRLARLLNLSTSTQHKLDDAAAGVLCAPSSRTRHLCTCTHSPRMQPLTLQMIRDRCAIVQVRR